jgi:hypothetical protein
MVALLLNWFYRAENQKKKENHKWKDFGVVKERVRFFCGFLLDYFRLFSLFAW